MYQPELGRFLQPDPKQFDAGDYNLYRYCHNDPVNKRDPLGLDTAVAIGGLRWDQWTDMPNPLGHASLALTGQGTFSFGTGTPQGTSFTSFLGDQAGHRFTNVYILKTTPAEEAAMKQNLEESAQKGSLPDIFKDPAGAHNDNCSTRTADALRAGGQDVGHPKTPAQLQHKLDQKVRNGSATRIFIPQKLAPVIPPILKDFNKK
jgi:hypothetical protein